MFLKVECSQWRFQTAISVFILTHNEKLHHRTYVLNLIRIVVLARTTTNHHFGKMLQQILWGMPIKFTLSNICGMTLRSQQLIISWNVSQKKKRKKISLAKIQRAEIHWQQPQSDFHRVWYLTVKIALVDRFCQKAVILAFGDATKFRNAVFRNFTCSFHAGSIFDSWNWIFETKPLWDETYVLTESYYGSRATRLFVLTRISLKEGFPKVIFLSPNCWFMMTL